MFRTPGFWSRRDAFASLVLLPVSWLYGLAHAIHQRTGNAYSSKIPVLCVGNLTAGGAGKTPTVIAIARLLKDSGAFSRPHFLTRGYGGTTRGPVLVDRNHGAPDIGDEPLLLAPVAPAIVSRDRAAGAKLAEQSGADIILMDDGLQNPGLKKKLRLVVVDAVSAFGNERLLPAGPLRTPLTTGLASADAFVVIGGAPPASVVKTGKPVFTASIVTGWKPSHPSYFAFSGIGRPEKFYDTLKAAGATLAGTKSFPDHHAYTSADMNRLLNDARARHARPITTVKDAVKLPVDFIAKDETDILHVDLKWDDPNAVQRYLQQQFKAHV